MWEKKKKLKNRYNSTAKKYDKRYQNIQEQKYRPILKELKNTEKILDIGCGTGMLLEKTIDKIDLAVGVDFSQKMLEKAKARLPEDCSLVLGDADNLPFQDNTFDSIVSITLLQNMPDPEKTISEIARVVSSNGKLILTALKKKHSLDKLKKWITSGGFEVLRAEDIPDSEDILCIGILAE